MRFWFPINSEIIWWPIKQQHQKYLKISTSHKNTVQFSIVQLSAVATIPTYPALTQFWLICLGVRLHWHFLLLLYRTVYYTRLYLVHKASSLDYVCLSVWSWLKWWALIKAPLCPENHMPAHCWPNMQIVLVLRGTSEQ